MSSVRNFFKINKACCLVWIFALLFIQSCVNDKPIHPDLSYEYESGDKVYFVNEGNYGSGNASLAIYNPSSGKLYNDVFYNVNGYKVGDVLQSVMRVDNTLLLAVDNSHQLISVDVFTMKELSSLVISNPRYMLSISPDKMYISSLYNNIITVYNPLNNSVVNQIILSSFSPEKMIIHDGYVYAASWDTANSLVYKIDPSSDAILQQIDIGHSAPQAIEVDASGHLWIFYGNSKYAKPYGVVVYDPMDDTIIKNFDMGLGVEMIKPIMNTLRDTVYWLGVDYDALSALNGVYRMSIESTEVPERPFIPAARYQYFYALGYDHLRKQLYVGDPKSFTERSDVYIYNLDGSLHKTLQTGMGIGSFYFSY